MASLFTAALEQVGQLHKADDDLIDRLNHRFTVILLVTFTAFVSAKQFVGDPISCWSPAHFSGGQVAYTNSICWLKGTYYLESNQQIIPQPTQNSQFRVAYYQFVPYMLLIMAGLFYLPHILWRNLSRHIGFDLRGIIQSIKKNPKTDIDQVAVGIHIALQCNSSEHISSHYKSFSRLLDTLSCAYRYRNCLSILYLLIKLLYMINCLCQFYVLSLFLSFPFHKFGLEWFSAMLHKVHTRTNKEENDSKWFPRTVMCDFMVRHLGSNQHSMVIQCNLPINLFNELIFVIIWAWLIFLSGLTCVSLILSLILTCTNCGHTSIRKYLPVSSLKLEQDKFIENYLKWDGVLVLRIIARNTNDVLMSNLVGALFNIYLDSMEKDNNDNDSDDRRQSTGDYIRIAS